MRMQKTTILKGSEVSRDWYIVDATGKPLGRLASKVAQVLRGKGKVGYAPFMDYGDFVVVVNASNVSLSGKKREMKTYWRYTGYPGGLRTTAFKDVIADNPGFVIMHAVKGMLPHNRLGRRLLKKLKVYSGPEHPHDAQKPRALEI
jgi:large subunit ribosomal protein L13